VNLGEYLIALLEQYDVEAIFGIPGVHTAEMYRGLATSSIRHITPRHEQGAGFMADGYARISGKPGVCLVITGPGLSNIATAMLQAKGDSIPMLVISGVNARGDMGSGRGYLHEMPNQQAFAAQCSVFSHTILTPDEVPSVLARAFAVFEGARPGPVHIEIPLDLMGASTNGLPLPKRAAAVTAPVPDSLDEAVAEIDAASAPIILLGGGAKRGAADAVTLAERLDCPLVTTMSARSSIPHGHSLHVGASPGHGPVAAMIDSADLVLAFGTEMGPTDYLDFDTGTEPRPQRLLRVDIDAAQMGRRPIADIALVGDAAAVLGALAGRVAEVKRDGAGRTAIARAAVLNSLPQNYTDMLSTLNALRDAVPDAMWVGDSTQLVYTGNLAFAPGDKGAWLNSSSGFGTLGYGLPAAIGAKLADPSRPSVVLIGDGGIQFTLGELGTAMDEALPIVVVVWNNSGYGEIRSFMENRQIKPEGVNLTPPDFTLIGRAYGFETVALDGAEALPDAVAHAVTQNKPTLIEVCGVT
jgi:acetolactate synthase-1/2/3 large subunit